MPRRYSWVIVDFTVWNQIQEHLIDTWIGDRVMAPWGDEEDIRVYKFLPAGQSVGCYHIWTITSPSGTVLVRNIDHYKTAKLAGTLLSQLLPQQYKDGT